MESIHFIQIETESMPEPNWITPSFEINNSHGVQANQSNEKRKADESKKSKKRKIFSEHRFYICIRTIILAFVSF